MRENLLCVAEMQLTYRNSVPVAKRKKIYCSSESAAVLRDLYDPGSIEVREEAKVLFLNRANHVVGYWPASTGGTAGTIMEPKLIIAAAILANASSIILCHNHPSGSLSASRQDISVTKKIKEAADFLDISVLDHIIITSESYLSFSDEGLL